MKALFIVALLLFLVFPTMAQETAPESEASELLTGVQDNSFLLEEAYNQEPGVVQHINMFLYDRDLEAWAYAFTQEWPVRSMTHQLSYTIPVGHFNGETKLGDVALNYRYQLVGNGESHFAVSPRVSLLLPTGEGSDETGVQVGVPFSTILGQRTIAHTNVGATWFTNDRDMEFGAGQSLIFAITPRFNALVEAVWSGTSDEGDLVISPGIRWAYNRPNGSQLVPGLAYVMSTEDEESNAVLLYLSYENRFGRK